MKKLPFPSYDVWNAACESSLSQTTTSVLQHFGQARNQQTGLINDPADREAFHHVTAESIGRRMKVHPRTVERHIEQLKALGILVIKSDKPAKLGVKGGRVLPDGRRTKERIVELRGAPPVYEIDLSRVPMADPGGGTSGTGSEVEEDDGAGEGPTSDRVPEVVPPEGGGTSDRVPEVFSTSDRGSQTSDPRSEAIYTKATDPADRSISATGPEWAAAVTDAIAIARRLATDYPADVAISAPTKAEQELISRFIRHKVIIPEDLGSVAVWLEFELRRKDPGGEVQRRFWVITKRCWTTLLGNTEQLERRITTGRMLESTRQVRIVDLPQADPLPPDDAWWRDQAAIHPDVVDNEECPPSVRDEVWKARIAEDPTWAHDRRCPASMYVRPASVEREAAPPAVIPPEMAARIERAKARQAVG